MPSHMSSHWSLTARAGAGFGPGAGEGLASLPSGHRQAGQEPAPAVLPAAPAGELAFVSSQQLITRGWRLYKIRILFHN